MSALMVLCTACAVCVVGIAAAQNCTWTLNLIGTTRTLDLRPLQNIALNTTDGISHEYVFTVCENGVQCGSGGDSVMTCQQSEYILGRWDASVLPSWSSENGGTWSFAYRNGDTDCGNPARTWAPTFVCNEHVHHSIGEVSEVAGSCYYRVTIETMFACPNFTTTTQEPDDPCRYRDGNAVLDLSSLRGNLINVQFNDSLTRSGDDYFMYSPCQNTAKCDADEATMAYVFDFDSLQCSHVLAVWEEGLVQPFYLQQARLWQFTYVNGDECQGGQTVFNLEYVCVESANEPQVLQAQQIADCVYQMVIASVLACV
eukprot:CAMPEP_0197021690 /NCGR_PEP_ID=MMETSP1384-20130603/2635_1 /TAXON_ID=29189 /ORGANISM="Ammonia sp." /LENGTH=313 /DNA_ID=CAMNT_0042449577 /DNA_START=17 /DNA_END=958 /DNA_ORIENTATION=-